MAILLRIWKEEAFRIAPLLFFPNGALTRHASKTCLATREKRKRRRKKPEWFEERKKKSAILVSGE